MTLPTLNNALAFRCIGPYRGGRVVAVAGDPVDPATFYFGACAGGVWKTTDGGAYWENVSDGFFKTAAVGALAVAPSDPNVVYAGMGETCIRGNVSHGDGVYRSTDAGASWKPLGLSSTRHIAKVRVHPQNPDLVYVAALGHAWGNNQERGVYRSSNGGRSWERVLYRNERAGAIDLSLDPRNARILYASFWEAQRTPYSLSSGGPGSGIFKSTDGGDSWAELTNNPGLPEGVKGKIGVTVSPAKTNRVWAIVEAADGALFCSDDGGASWERRSEQGDLRRRAWYYCHVIPDPLDPETVWVLNVRCWKSIDGGRTFSAVPTPHADNHDLWIDPQYPRRMIEGNDGGACVSFNNGETWSSIYNQPTAQFYHVTTDKQDPYRVYGSQQDNTAISIPSFSSEGAITQTDWVEPGGGESGYIAIRPDDPAIVVAGAIGSGFGNGRLIQYDRRTGQRRNITVWPEVTGMGYGAKDLKHRFQWTFPISFSVHDPGVLYTAANRLFRSLDEGESWEPISPALTRNAHLTQEPSGGPITKDNTGAEVYGTIFAFAESPHERDVFWVGTDDGLLQLSRDGGQTWVNVTPSNLPEWALISIVEPSPHDPASAYVAATRYKHDDCQPLLLKTDDYGATWSIITKGIPRDDFTRVIREDPTQRGLLFVGTETGVYVSFDDGGVWEPLRGNLPVVPIHDLIVEGDDLIVATHGRSFWILDDVGPLRQIANGIGDAPIHLFQPDVTVARKTYADFGKPDKGRRYVEAGPVGICFRHREGLSGEPLVTLLDAGKNPPDGMVVTYYLREEPTGDVLLTFLDSGGKVIRSFSSKHESKPTGANAEDPKAKPEPRVPKAAGLNSFIWNLRYPDAPPVAGDTATEDLLSGPRIVPGNYQVRLTIDGQTFNQLCDVRIDPRVHVSGDELQAQFDLLKRIQDKLAETHNAINEIRDLRTQVDAWSRRAGGEHDTVATAAANLDAAFRSVEEALIQAKADSPLGEPLRLNAKLTALATFVDSADAAPTRQAQEVFDDLATQIDAQLARLRELRATDVAAFSDVLREAAVPPVRARTTPA
jgi:photosystem II stability/assembly factor-like uncharacterized protein